MMKRTLNFGVNVELVPWLNSTERAGTPTGGVERQLEVPVLAFVSVLALKAALWPWQTESGTEK